MQTGFKEEIFYDGGGEAQEQVVLPRWWMPHPWKYSRSGQTGL